MPTNPPQSSPYTPTEWTGTVGYMQKWLARRCAVDSLVNLAGSFFFLIIGLVALIVTSGATAAVVFIILIEASAILSALGAHIVLLRPLMFAILFFLFLALTIVHAYKTRAGADTPAKFDFDLSIGFALLWEFISAGPILLVLSGQEFHRYLSLSRLDVPQVSALLLWIYDKGGRASFTEICFAFPQLNAVRVLPQLRDLSGIHWWPEDAEISFSDDLLRILAAVLHREPKTPPYTHHYRYTYGYDREQQRQRPQTPVEELNEEIRSWYATLDLPQYATLQVVKKRFRKLAKIYHPDVQSASSDKASNEEQMKRINEAYHNILRHAQSQPGATP
jgi:hypothetical protein